MPTIIDGCNVLGQLGRLFQPRADEYLLENYIIPYSHFFNKRVWLIFDNADYNSYARDHFKIGLITVRYAQHGLATADDLIISMIKKSVDPAGLTLISSDRELLDLALLYKCAVNRSEEFIAMVDNCRQVVHWQDNVEKELSEAEMSAINEELLAIWGGTKE